MTTTNTTEATNTASLYDYQDGAYIRPATADELAASIEAAEHDGGAGVIVIGDRSCFATA